MRILVQAGDEAVARVRAALPRDEVQAVAMSGENATDVWGEVLLTLRNKVSGLDHVLKRGVEWVHVLTTGVNSFPFEVLGDQILTCSRGASADPISEWCLTMMLAFEKRLPAAWITRPPAPPDRWHRLELGSLRGRTVGIFGFGAVGQALASLVRPFGGRMLAMRRTSSVSPVPDVELVRGLDELLGPSDHVVIAAPSTPRTNGLFSLDRLRLMKPGAHLVNVSRGELVVERDLRLALDSGQIALASLDAFAQEPLPDGHWMYQHPRVRVSPHISWCAPEALDQLYAAFFGNVERWRRGRALEGVVDVTEGY